MLGTKAEFWSTGSLEFVSSMLFAVALFVLLVRALAFYGAPQEYEEASKPFRKMLSESVRKTWRIWIAFLVVWAVLPWVLWSVDS